MDLSQLIHDHSRRASEAAAAGAAAGAAFSQPLTQQPGSALTSAPTITPQPPLAQTPLLEIVLAPCAEQQQLARYQQLLQFQNQPLEHINHRHEAWPSPQQHHLLPFESHSYASHHAGGLHHPPVYAQDQHLQMQSLNSVQPQPKQDLNPHHKLHLLHEHKHYQHQSQQRTHYHIPQHQEPYNVRVLPSPQPNQGPLPASMTRYGPEASYQQNFAPLAQSTCHGAKLPVPNSGYNSQVSNPSLPSVPKPAFASQTQTQPQLALPVATSNASTPTRPASDYLGVAHRVACNACGRAFDSTHAFESHKTIFHNRSISPSNQRPAAFPCEVCGKGVYNIPLLFLHVYVASV
jgi:hypothetical protein